MVNGLKLPRDQMIFSVDELKKAGYSHYKINQLVEDGTLLNLIRSTMKIQNIMVKNLIFTTFRHTHRKVWFVL